MFDKIISFSIRRRGIIFSFVLALIIAGGYATTQLPIDAIPDITNNQVMVLTTAPALAPMEVERLITYPIEIAMRNLPDVEQVWSLSKFGLSSVTIVFKDNVDMYFARQLVLERITMAKANIPQGVGDPELGPLTTGIGEIYQYLVKGKNRTAMELKTIQEWTIKPQLLSVEGIAEVTALGGETRQVQVSINPDVLRKYGISFAEIFKALEMNNSITGGAYIEHNGEQYLVRGVGYVQNTEDIKKIVVKNDNSTPVTIGDVANVVNAPAVRQGAATEGGKGEVVCGVVMMLKGKNSREVSQLVEARMKEIQKTLPPDVTIEPFYNRAHLVDRTINTVFKNLAEGCLLVIVIVLFLLLNFRAGLIVASVIPLAMLFSVLGMYLTGQTGNLMSLGAIDFGLIIDGTIIVVEACLAALAYKTAHIGRPLTKAERSETVHDATLKIRRAAQFGELIILIVYLPIYTLQGIEGKMFKPMAWTVSFAVIGALILALTYVPAMTSAFLRSGPKEKISPLISFLQRFYTPLLQKILHKPMYLIAGAVVLFVGSLFVLINLGGVFLPTLDEGDILLETRKLPSVSLTETIRISTELEKVITTFPEVTKVVTKLGRPDIAGDQMSIHQGDVYIDLEEDHSKWKTADTKAELIEKMEKRFASVPGIAVSFSQPMQMRFNELMTGIKSDVGVKFYGDDFEKLSNLTKQAERILSSLEGAQDIKITQIDGLPQYRISPDRDKLARFGLNVSDINDAIEIALAGKTAGKFYEGEKQFDLVVRYDEHYRASIEDISTLPIGLRSGELIRLDQVGNVDVIDGPSEIRHEQGRRLMVVETNVRNRDIASFISELRSKIDKEITLPEGYNIEYGGEFKNLERASARLQLVVPLALLLIFVLLFQTFHSVKNALLVFTGIPFSLIGGIAALWIAGLTFSISAGVGFIALFGVAVLNGIVLISAIEHMREGHELHEAILLACKERLRPVITTALVASLGFIPMAISSGAGSEVQRPLATVVIGGLISSTLLTLLLLPSLYKIFQRKTKTII